MERPRNARAALLLIALAASTACVTPRPGNIGVNSKPGWGRSYTREEAHKTVRAIPAAAAPSVPVTRRGKPGWGRE